MAAHRRDLDQQRAGDAEAAPASTPPASSVQAEGDGLAKRERKASRNESKAREARSAPLENSIRPTKRLARGALPSAPAQAPLWSSEVREHDASPPRPATPPASADSPAEAVPDEVRRRFVQVGKTFFFPDGAKAFIDRGKRLTTPSENTEVIRSLVSIAQARGWGEIAVSGTERFRKEAWAAARMAGLAVRGYAPSDFKREHLARTIARKAGAERGETAPSAPTTVNEPDEGASGRKGDRQGTLLIGRLVDHGHATYKHEPREAMSYFVKIETGRGERTIWGVDLERALRESLTQPKQGDEIGLRSVGRDVVTVKTPARDAAGREIGQKDLAAHRNRWIVEKRELFDERADAARTLRDAKVEPRRAVRSHPELVGTYLYLRGAQEIAAKRIRDPEDRKKFVALVRSALADSVERGEPLPAVRLRDRGRSQERALDRDAERAR